MVQSSVYCTFQIPSRVLLINIHQYKSILLNLGFVAQISHSQDASPKAFPRLDHMSPTLKTCQSIMFTLSVVYQLDTMAKLAIQALNIHVTMSRLTSTQKCGVNQTCFFYCPNCHGKEPEILDGALLSPTLFFSSLKKHIVNLLF